jgi:sulfur dioxygenase
MVLIDGFIELNRGGCKSYLLGCEKTRKAILIDPVRERVALYLAVLAYHGYRAEFVIDTHTHADHPSGIWDLQALTGAKLVTHRLTPAPGIDIHVCDRQRLACGSLEMTVLHTPGHTPDSISILVGERIFTGDTLLIHGTGRTDLAGGDPAIQYDSIVSQLFTLPDSTKVFPGHDYRGQTHSTIGHEKVRNPRLAGRSRQAYIDLMNDLNLPLPERIQEVLQANQTAIDDGSLKFPSLSQLNTVRQISPIELDSLLKSSPPPLLVDVSQPEEFAELGHIQGSLLIPLRQLTVRVGELESVREREVVVVSRTGVRSTTAAAILSAMGFEHVSNLEGGMLEWNEQGLPTEP